ncbi:MAG: YdcF family protein [Betaproteobacteria bacterium]
MTPPIWFKALLKGLLLPPVGLLLVALLGIGLSICRPRAGRVLGAVSLVALLALSMPAIGDLLVAALTPPPPFAREDAVGAGAIVILGGGVRREAPDYGSDTLATLTLERVRYGARVAKQTGLPVLVSGGHPEGAESEAVLMQRALEEEFHVRVRWVEQLSGNTHENAVNSAQLLRAAGIGKIVLVAHSFDMKRAVAEFSAAGMTVVPAATNLPARGPSTLTDWWPSMDGLQTSYFATYEIAANAMLLLGHVTR